MKNAKQEISPNEQQDEGIRQKKFCRGKIKSVFNNAFDEQR